MSRARALLGIALLGLLVAGAYLVGTGQQLRKAGANTPAAEQPAYDYEANDVVVRQMDATGRLQYEIQARHVAQLPQNGAIAASQLTLHYDPSEGVPDPARRWTLTADSAQLPAGSDLVTLQGKVLVTGRPQGSVTLTTLSTDRLQYNLATQELRNNSAVEMRWGQNRLAGRNLRANIKQGNVALESEINGHIIP